MYSYGAVCMHMLVFFKFSWHTFSVKKSCSQIFKNITNLLIYFTP